LAGLELPWSHRQQRFSWIIYPARNSHLDVQRSAAIDGQRGAIVAWKVGVLAYHEALLGPVVEPGNGVFVANDHMSIGLLSALRERGIRVPDDVSVVGFDDVPEAGYVYPPLTTVRQDFATLGELIMQKVLVSVEEPDGVTEDTPIATRLIVRQSTRAVNRAESSADPRPHAGARNA